MATSLKNTIARKAAKTTAKTTAKHTAHGTVSKLKRSPVRTTTLLALGGVVGFVAGRLAAPSPSSG